MASRSADPPIPLPSSLPIQTPPLDTAQYPRYSESSIYPYLETNVDAIPMSFELTPFPSDTTEWSRGHYGDTTPFRPWTAVRQYVQDVAALHPDFIEFGVTVERAAKVPSASGGEEWELVLRKSGTEKDYWWTERFDALVVASGHYHVPYIPPIPGLEEYEAHRPGSVIHSKHFRGRDLYAGRRLVVVGASVSAADIAFDLAPTSQVFAVMVGRTFNGYFGGGAFEHPRITQCVTIDHIRPASRTVVLQDGTEIEGVDHIIFGTGYSWSLPFLPEIKPRNNRVPGLWQHIVHQDDPSLLFVGAVGAGLTFKIFEWQAVYVARLLAGRSKPLPSREEMQAWEEERVKVKGDGPGFSVVNPDFEAYFELLRELATEGKTAEGVGRKLPVFRREWHRAFSEGHELRKGMWRRVNAQALEELQKDTKL